MAVILFSKVIYLLTVTEYETYHQIAETLSFHVMHNLLLNSQGLLIY